ncbi:transposase [Salinarchaeum laminariae]|uniref:transposase n=1 Tax=Salinarchaeum laminariae TaxID=869888 RepID=UPI0020C10E50|nr:transposase [Salinarchaeum laminariae]
MGTGKKAGHPVSHTDSFTSTLTGSDGNYTGHAQYEDGVDETYGRDVTIESPPDDIATYQHRRPLEAILHETNRQEIQYSGDRTTVFDKAILDLANPALTVVDAPLSKLPVDPQYVKALLLHDAWCMNSRPGLTRHLENNPEISDRIGFESTPDQSTFALKAGEMADTGYRQAVQEAAIHAVFAAYRNGVEPPAEVKTAYELEAHETITDPALEATYHHELMEWIEFVFDAILDPLSFGRRPNRSKTVKQVLGSIALGALSNSPTAGYDTGKWRFDSDEIPTPAHVSELVRELEFDEITDMFTQVNRLFIRCASDLGFFDQEYDYAVDTTWIDWGRDAEDWMELINNPKECASGKGWCFAAVTVCDTDARFALGLDLVREKGATIQHFRRLLRMAAQEGEIGRIHADREFFAGDAVSAFRVLAGNHWVIRAKRQENGDVADAINNISGEAPIADTSLEFANLRKNVDFYAHPRPEKHRSNSDKTHMPFITDLPKEDTDLRSIYYQYAYRWSAETYFRQLKHRFAPTTESPSPKLRLFYLNVATIFYNIHTLINRATSGLGYPLNAEFYQVLNAIVETTFTRKHPTDPC